MDIMDKNGQNGQKWTKWTKRIKTYAGKMSLQLQITFTRFQSTTIRSQIVQIIQNTPFRRIEKKSTLTFMRQTKQSMMREEQNSNSTL